MATKLQVFAYTSDRERSTRTSFTRTNKPNPYCTSVCNTYARSLTMQCNVTHGRKHGGHVVVGSGRSTVQWRVMIERSYVVRWSYVRFTPVGQYQHDHTRSDTTDTVDRRDNHRDYCCQTNNVRPLPVSLRRTSPGAVHARTFTTCRACC